MGLIELKQYLSRVKITSLATLCSYFKADANFLRQMLAHWERKGCVKRSFKSTACGSKCQQCPELMIEFYEWTV